MSKLQAIILELRNVFKDELEFFESVSSLNEKHKKELEKYISKNIDLIDMYSSSYMLIKKYMNNHIKNKIEEKEKLLEFTKTTAFYNGDSSEMMTIVSSHGGVNKELIKKITNYLIINDLIANYNFEISKLYLSDKAIECKKIVDELNNVSTINDSSMCFEVKSIDSDTYDLFQLYFNIDPLFFIDDMKNIFYEGSEIFSEIPEIKSFVSNDKIKEIGNEIESLIFRSSKIQGVFELNFNDKPRFESTGHQLFISIDEFKTTLDRQLYELQENSNQIFSNLYKLLKIIELDQILKDDNEIT